MPDISRIPLPFALAGAIFGCLFSTALQAQTITQVQSLSFGILAVPGQTRTVIINDAGTVTSGSEWVLGGTQRNAEFTIGGADGLIDIAVVGVNTCDPNVTVRNFSGQFGNNPDILTNIDSVGATNIQLGAGNGNTLLLGAEIVFDENVPAGGCSIDFDLEVTY